MHTQCEVKEYPDRSVLSVRTHAGVQELPRILGDIYGRIMGYLAELKTQPTGMPFVIYYNMDMANLDIEVGFEAPAGLSGKGDIQAGAIPAAKVVSLILYGSLRGMRTSLRNHVQVDGGERLGGYRCGDRILFE